jgi:protein TonB
LVLHLALAAHLRSSRVDPTHAPRLPQKVEIEIARRPPKVLPPPEPPKPIELPKAQPKPATHAVSTRPIIPLANVAKMEGPASDEGTEPSPAEQAPIAVGAAVPAEVAGPAVEAPPAPPPPAPIVEAKEGANYLQNPRPAYPKLASRQGWEGTVLLRVHVLPSGRPDTMTVQKTSGHDVLDNAATDAVRGWTFTPATQGGKPIAGWVNVPIVFRFQ